MNDNFKYPKYLDVLSEIFENSGHSLYIVGGFVRDAFLGYEADDIDVCSDATPIKVIKMLEANVDFAVATCNFPLGTIIIRYKGVSLEYTAFRKESYRKDGTHTPEDVSFDATLKEDALRRDFSCNSIYFNINTKEIIDCFDSLGDIRKKILRTIRPPDEVFSEDALRILRMARIAAETGFIPAREAIESAQNLSHTLLKLSNERILQELKKLLESDTKYYATEDKNISRGINVLFESNAAQTLFSGTALEKSLLAAETKPFPVRVALLIYGCEDINKSLEYICPNGDVKRHVLFLLNQRKYDDRAALNLLAENGYQNGMLLGEFLSILNIGHDNLSKYLKNMQRSDYIISMKTLAVSGNDIKDELKLKDSPKIGKIKKRLLTHIIEHPDENSRDKLINYLKIHYESFSLSQSSKPE